jgi:hypothetical protein
MLLLDSENVGMQHIPVIDLMVDDVDPEGNKLNIVRDFGPGDFDLDLDPSQYFLT